MATYTVTIDDSHNQRVIDAFRANFADVSGLTDQQFIEHYLSAYVRGQVCAYECSDAAQTAEAGVVVPEDLSTP